MPVANSVMTMSISRYDWMCLVCKNLPYPHPIENHSNNICLIRPEEWNISCHSSKQMMSPSSAIVATMESELMSPEGTQVGKNTCHRAATRLQPLPVMSPEETQRCENAGYWPQMTKVRIKRMISASLDSCIFPYIERQKSTKFLNFRYLLFFKLTTNLLVIRLPFFKTSLSPGSPPLLASLDRFY